MAEENECANCRSNCECKTPANCNCGARCCCCRGLSAQQAALTGCDAGPECTCTTCKTHVPKGEQKRVTTEGHTFSDPENRSHKA